MCWLQFLGVVFHGVVLSCCGVGNLAASWLYLDQLNRYTYIIGTVPLSCVYFFLPYLSLAYLFLSIYNMLKVAMGGNVSRSNVSSQFVVGINKF